MELTHLTDSKVAKGIFLGGVRSPYPSQEVPILLRKFLSFSDSDYSHQCSFKELSYIVPIYLKVENPHLEFTHKLATYLLKGQSKIDNPEKLATNLTDSKAAKKNLSRWCAKFLSC